jgi:hypothetical protein
MGEDRRWARVAQFGVKKNERTSTAAGQPRQLPLKARVMGASARTGSRVRGARGRRGKKPGCPKLAEVRFLDIFGHRGERGQASPCSPDSSGGARSRRGDDKKTIPCSRDAQSSERVLRKCEIKRSSVHVSRHRPDANALRFEDSASRLPGARVFQQRVAVTRAPRRISEAASDNRRWNDIVVQSGDEFLRNSPCFTVPEFFPERC